MSQSRKTSHEMFPLVELYLAGDATQKTFCEEHKVSTAVLNYWIAKYRRREAAEADSGFVELRSNQASTELPFMEVVYPRGIRLRFFAPITSAYLDQLLASGR